MNLIESLAEKREEELRPFISNVNDLRAGEKPTLLYYSLIKSIGDLLDPDDKKILSKDSIRKRDKYYKLIKAVGPLTLKTKQVFENRNNLIDSTDNTPDKGIDLPSEPVIWVSNHAFKDDTLATILASQRHPYILFGSVPQFYNTFDGVLSYLNGVVMTNRKVKESRAVSVSKACTVLQNGGDLLMFPEGVWNKSPNALLIDLWPGVYRIAKETGAKVVPVAHYLGDLTEKDKNEKIHTVIDEPIDISKMDEKEALTLIRDTLASWHYLMMERYGKTTRDELLKGENPNDVWERLLEERVKTADRYDKEIELCADYRPKSIVRSENVFENVANISNVTPYNVAFVEDAKKLVKQRKKEDFQRRF